MASHIIPFLGQSDGHIIYSGDAHLSSRIPENSILSPEPFNYNSRNCDVTDVTKPGNPYRITDPFHTPAAETQEEAGAV